MPRRQPSELESRALAMLAGGETYQEVAEILKLAERTVLHWKDRAALERKREAARASKPPEPSQVDDTNLDKLLLAWARSSIRSSSLVKNIQPK